MHKQFFVLVDYREKNTHWNAGQVVDVEPEIALPLIGTVLSPLYSAIKAGLYPPAQRKPLAEKIVEELRKDIQQLTGTPQVQVKNTSNPGAGVNTPSKKFLQNSIREKILAKKAQRAKQNG